MTTSQNLLEEGREYSKRILQGLTAGVSHFHAVQYIKGQLRDNGFQEIKEIDQWDLEPGKGYYFSRNATTIAAFTVGNQCKEGVNLFKIVGCHTDSPCLKLAPRTKVTRVGYNQLNVQCYGGGLWRTWFDRDLGLAGKVIVKDGQTGKLKSMLWDSGSPLMNVASLCIHLDRSTNFDPNRESHIKPILATNLVD